VFVSEGLPHRLNRLTRYQTVQEGWGVWGTTGSTKSLFDVPGASSPLPEVRLRFTEVAWPADQANGRHLLNNNYLVARLALQDCQVHNAYLYAMPWFSDSREQAFAFTNSLFGRCSFSLESGYMGDTTPFAVDGYNNLLLRSTLYLNNAAYTNGAPVRTWMLKDNAFDNATASASGYLTLGNNGYINTTSLGGSTNVVVSSFTYAIGTLGNWYQASTNFIDKGSRTAGAAGLYHHTTTTNQIKEASSAVDIGFHLIAVDTATGLPLDYDGDGLPDYFEDRNGNGVYDPGASETDWANSPNGTTGTTGLQVFTPFE
jgi:hypothetical protein